LLFYYGNPAFGELFSTAIILILVPALFLILEDVHDVFSSRTKTQRHAVPAVH